MINRLFPSSNLVIIVEFVPLINIAQFVIEVQKHVTGLNFGRNQQDG